MSKELIVTIAVVLLNIGVVAGVRHSLAERGREALAESGRLTFALVFGLNALYLLVQSQFGALADADALVELLQDASAMTVAAMGTHGASKTVGLSKLLSKALGITLILAVLIIPMAAISVSADEPGNAKLGEGIATYPVYLQSFSARGSEIAAGVSIDIGKWKLGQSTMVGGVSPLITSGGQLGIGLSTALSDGIVRAGVGIYYTPDRRWSWGLSLVQVRL
jgi:hypothetical protein